jgi:transcription elongation factor Elf1
MSGDSHNTPVTFSRDEIAEIRVMLATWDKALTCPRCKNELRVEEPDADQLKGQIYLKCHACNRTAFVSREPHQRPPDFY